jgi:hypothetical protein
VLSSRGYYANLPANEQPPDVVDEIDALCENNQPQRDANDYPVSLLDVLQMAVSQAAARNMAHSRKLAKRGDVAPPGQATTAEALHMIANGQRCLQHLFRDSMNQLEHHGLTLAAVDGED